MWRYFLLPTVLFAQSMLTQADELAKKFSVEIAKAPPPLLSPQPKNCLDTASVWFSIDLAELLSPALTHLDNEQLWSLLQEIGVQGVHLQGLKSPTAIGLNPQWGSDWDDVAILLQKKGLVLIGDSIGSSTGLGRDFTLALKNVGEYPGLYHLIEIEKRDWKVLPQVGPSQLATNVPWLGLQQLDKRGYVPEQFAPYVKQSQWNATAPVKCEDGKLRRWIYLQENGIDPVIDWLNPSFAGFRIATADALDSIYNLGQKILTLPAAIPANTRETLALWTRKIGAFAVQEAKGGIEELKNGTSDLITDTLTRPALLHALLAEDTEALKLMYRLLLAEGIETKRLVHILQPFDEYTCDWAELLLNPRKKFEYYDEILTGEALRSRLLQQDVATLTGPATWTQYCMTALGASDFDSRRDDVLETHLLLAFFYAMQPGAFSFSMADLLGMVSKQTVDLMEPSAGTLYASLPGQFKNDKSFALRLKKMLSVRRDASIATGELIAVPKTQQPGLMILIHQLNGAQQLLAVNFSKSKAQQTLEMPAWRNTTAIDLMTGLAEKKPLESSTLRLDLPPLTGKVILFQPKYYD
jgi:trehalose synthase